MRSKDEAVAEIESLMRDTLGYKENAKSNEERIFFGGQYDGLNRALGIVGTIRGAGTSA